MQKSVEMPIRYCALALGSFFLILAIAGFIPGFVHMSPMAPGGFGYVLGIFPTNFLHNAFGIAIGVLGLAAFTSLTGSIVFNQLFAIIYGAQALLGLLPGFNTFFGTMPLYGNNIWLSLIAAGFAYYFGFTKPMELRRGITLGTGS